MDARRRPSSSKTGGTARKANSLALLAVILSAYALYRQQPTQPPTANPDIKHLETQMHALEKKLSDLSQSVSQVSAQLVHRQAIDFANAQHFSTNVDSRLEPDAPVDEVIDGPKANENTKTTKLTPAGFPVFSGFKPSSPSITVTQVESGSLAVTNTDPALTGQLQIVEAVTADGEIMNVTVEVPPTN